MPEPAARRHLWGCGRASFGRCHEQGTRERSRRRPARRRETGHRARRRHRRRRAGRTRASRRLTLPLRAAEWSAMRDRFARDVLGKGEDEPIGVRKLAGSRLTASRTPGPGPGAGGACRNADNGAAGAGCMAWGRLGDEGRGEGRGRGRGSR